MKRSPVGLFFFVRLNPDDFVGFGDVAKDIGGFALKNFKRSVGIGMRYLLVPAEKLGLRLDFGWGKNSSGFYPALSEAF